MSVKRALKWVAVAVPVALLLATSIAWVRSDNACSARDAAATPIHPMRAVVYCDYGPPETLQVARIERPVPGPDEILVRVRAASINPLDWHFMRGEPYIGRLDMGLRRPKQTRLGVDFAGTVEAVGQNVTRFKPGDDVFGGRTGAFAEYVTVRADRNVVPKPTNVSFEQAAAIPVAAITALQAVRDQGKVRPGQRVLVNGASGGVGTFAVQIARALGAEVTGVSSTRNVELVRSLGAARVVDYTKADFTRDSARYDVIIDNVGNRSFADIRRALRPGGTYVIVGGEKGRWLDPMPRAAGAWVLSHFVKEDLRFFLARLNPQDLGVLHDLVQSGRVTPVLDRTYDLDQVREAVRYQEAGHARGKVVLTMK